MNTYVGKVRETPLPRNDSPNIQKNTPFFFSSQEKGRKGEEIIIYILTEIFLRNSINSRTNFGCPNVADCTSVDRYMLFYYVAG